MKKTYFALAMAAAISAQGTSVFAQDYQIEGGLTYGAISPDVGDSDSAIGLDGTYHIESVSTSGVVLNEAAFVGRNNNLYANFLQVQDAETDESNIGVEWWFEDIYAALNMNDDDGFGTNTVRVGYMVQENTLVNLVMQTGDQPEDGMGLEAKYVGDLGENTINLEASYIDTDGNTATEFGGDYYFSDELSAGLTIADSDGAADPTNTIRVKNFFTPVISGELHYAVTGDDSVTALRGAMRF